MQVLPVGGIYTALEEEKRRAEEERRRKEMEERARKEGGCPSCCTMVGWVFILDKDQFDVAPIARSQLLSGRRNLTVQISLCIFRKLENEKTSIFFSTRKTQFFAPVYSRFCPIFHKVISLKWNLFRYFKSLRYFHIFSNNLISPPGI